MDRTIHGGPTDSRSWAYLLGSRPGRKALSMQSLPVVETKAPGRRLPAWLKRPLPRGNENFFTDTLLHELRLETVCENARCPSRHECYSRRTATFMILGNVCTRTGGF